MKLDRFQFEKDPNLCFCYIRRNFSAKKSAKKKAQNETQPTISNLPLPTHPSTYHVTLLDQ